VIENILYPFKVWITSVLVRPIVVVISILMFDADNNTIFNGIYPFLYLMTVVFSGLYSFPCFLFLWLCYHLLSRCNLAPLALRSVLLIISILTCIAVFLVFSFIDTRSIARWDSIRTIGSFAIPLAFGIIVYDLENQQQHREI
jgi:hypothetical protein